jgi:aminomethyltransferase
MQTAAPILSTPLFERHVALGAQMAPFAGWNMPIQYEGIIAEAQHARRQASCFDTCHMGEFLLRGDLKRSGLDRIICGRLDNLPPNTCRYSSILNERGGVLDDLLIYRQGAEEWFIVVNAGTIARDKEHFLRHLSRDAEFKDLSATLGKIDIQGPYAKEALRRLSADPGRLKYYTFVETSMLSEKVILSRTGYTGELGFEVYASHDKIRGIWDALLGDKNVRPAGLGSRDILRLEMGYSLYGQDMDETITPLEAGLEAFVDFNKDFIGKEALLAQKKESGRRSRVFIKSLSRRAPRHLHKIYAGGREAGVVTSGTFSPHLSCGIGMGFAHDLKTGQEVFVGDEKTRIDAVIVNRPFLKETSLKD